VKSLSTPVANAAASSQSAWCELVDIYLKSAISTPWGSLSTLRLTTYPTEFTFFAPLLWPEPDATLGSGGRYKPWPLKREPVASSSQFTDQKMVLVASNVTAEWAAMITSMDWYDVPVIIRKVPVASGSTASDCAVLWSGFIDSISITNDQIQITCSNDLGNLASVLPVENMHQNCRFQWGDDFCTALRFRASNYMSKEVGTGSTTTLIKTTELTEDTAVAPYAGQAVTAQAAGDTITLTAHGLSHGDRVRFEATSMPGGLSSGRWYFIISPTANTFQVSTTDGGLAIDITSAGSGVTITSSVPYGTDLINALSDGAITASSAAPSHVNTSLTVSVPLDLFYTGAKHKLSKGDAIQFSATTMPAPLVAGTTYYAVPLGDSSFKVSPTRGSKSWIDITTTGSSVRFSTVENYDPFRVKTGTPGYWKFGTDADWGTRADGYWTIPTAEAGLANPLLKPYITFDLGSAKRPRVWRLENVPGLPREEMVRMVAIFSSSVSNFATYTHESYVELPPRGGQWIDVLIPAASTARYWRLCVRSRWAESLYYTMFNKVQAFEAARNFWQSGRITFSSSTGTAALRGVTAPILESYAGAIRVPALPVAPAGADLFTIERGCPRTWNACCERRNWENFGGFLDLPNQSMLR
jgi:hypothetical protein